MRGALRPPRWPRGWEPTAEDLRRHVRDELLPLWARRGIDANGVFVNRLDARRRQRPDGYTRALVQARQLYAFTRGFETGRDDASQRSADAGDDASRRSADAALHALREVFLDRHHGGFFFTARASGEPLDRRKDLYVQAFAVFALAHRGRVFGDRDALALAEETGARVEDHLRDARRGGYVEVADEDWTPRRGPRRQNPHMHLLEAWLALHAATGDAAALERARRLVRLLEERLLDARGPLLPEVFDAEWRAERDARGPTVEPGHHFEWCWLLHRYAEVAREPVHPAADELFRFAERHGLDADGLVVDALDGAGATRRGSKRLWPQTERLKALAARGDRAELERSLGRVFAAYQRASDGGWTEHLTRDGAVRTEVQNATSVYHVVLALGEAEAALETRDGAPRDAAAQARSAPLPAGVSASSAPGST